MGKTSIMQCACERDHAGRRVLRPLEHDGAAGRQRRSHLLDGLHDRKIPRCESRADADWLTQNGLPHERIAGGHDAAVNAPSFFRVPGERIGSGIHFPDRLRERFALIERDLPVDFRVAFAKQR